jgi:hypothetical protein
MPLGGFVDVSWLIVGLSPPQRGVPERGETAKSRRCGDEAEPPGKETARLFVGSAGVAATRSETQREHAPHAANAGHCA